MARTYTLKKRAESRTETRRRIVEAALELHGSIGPALTTLSMVAERAGVQRHTVYAHFPDARSLYMASSALHLDRDPLFDAPAWRGMEGRRERLHTGLSAIYGWYDRNAGITANVLRDAEHHALIREIAALRFGRPMAAYREALGTDLNATQRVLLELALSFFTWRSLVRESGFTQEVAAGAMVQAIACHGEGETYAQSR
jgi:AcrR family transcriptional regulator